MPARCRGVGRAHPHDGVCVVMTRPAGISARSARNWLERAAHILRFGAASFANPRSSGSPGRRISPPASISCHYRPELSLKAVTGRRARADRKSRRRRRCARWSPTTKSSPCAAHGRRPAFSRRLERVGSACRRAANSVCRSDTSRFAGRRCSRRRLGPSTDESDSAVGQAESAHAREASTCDKFGVLIAALRRPRSPEHGNTCFDRLVRASPKSSCAPFFRGPPLQVVSSTQYNGAVPLSMLTTDTPFAHELAAEQRRDSASWRRSRCSSSPDHRDADHSGNDVARAFHPLTTITTRASSSRSRWRATHESRTRV